MDAAYGNVIDWAEEMERADACSGCNETNPLTQRDSHCADIGLCSLVAPHCGISLGMKRYQRYVLSAKSNAWLTMRYCRETE
jgi:hypothetical protein